MTGPVCMMKDRPTTRSPVVTASTIAAMSERLGFSIDADEPSAFDRYHSFYAIGSDTALIGERFQAEVECVRLDRMMVHDRRLRAVAHSRDMRRVRQAELNHFTVTLCLGGTMFGAGSQGFRRIQPGEIWVADMTQPVQTRIEEARLMTVAVARDVVEAATPHARRLHATVLSASRAAPLTRALVGLTGRSATLSTDDGALAAQHVTRLIGAVLGQPSVSDAIRLERLAQARRLIDAQLDRPELDAAAIAAALGLSRSTVYRLFEPVGGVTRYIQTRRVERLRRLLSERAVDTSLADLAALVGFASESHASRLFLDRFGLRPGAFRSATHGLSDFAVGLVRMSGWLAGLQ